MRIRLILCAAAFALIAGACGADDAITVTEPAAPETPAEATVEETTTEGTSTGGSAPSASAVAGPGDVPDVEMIDVHTGETVNLQAVVTGQTPLLFWFWAPH